MMLLDFDELLAEMPKEVSEAVKADLQQTMRDRAAEADSKLVAYSKVPDQVPKVAA